jgi:hypothetical protein
MFLEYEPVVNLANFNEKSLHILAMCKRDEQSQQNNCAVWKKSAA